MSFTARMTCGAVTSCGGADGLTLTLANPAAGATPNAVGGVGGRLGFGGIPGVAVALDTYKSGADPSRNFVGIARSAAGDTTDPLPYLATSVTSRRCGRPTGGCGSSSSRARCRCGSTAAPC